MTRSKKRRRPKGLGSSSSAEPSASEPEPADAQTPHSRKRRRSKLKLWGFRIGAVVFGGVLLVILEALLVLFGVGQDLDLVVKVPGQPRILRYQVNHQVEKLYFNGKEVAGPEPRRFDLPRPEGVFRIVVVGASTVLGFPYPPELAFPRQLEVLLNHQNEALRFEVINAGIVGINTFSLTDVVKQAAALEPDLIIVHAGHNEFYGPAGVSSTAVEPQALYPLALMLRRPRVFQLIANALKKNNAPDKNLIETLPESVTVAWEGPEFRKAEYYYRHNLEQIVSTAKSAGIPILLTTVASNLSGHSPVSFLAPEKLDPETGQRWLEHFHQGEELSANGDWALALTQLEQAQAISEDSSLLYYRMGQCLEGLERYPDARQAFERARDLDGCRFRAPSSFRGIVREVAHQCSPPRVFFLDTAEQVAEEAGPKSLGVELFLEHVHYNLKGHRLLALILGRFVQEQVLREAWNPAAIPPDEQFDQWLGMLPEDQLAGLSYALQLMNVFPMAKTFDINVHKAKLLAEIEEAYKKLDPKQQQVFADLSLTDMAERLAEALGDRARTSGRPGRELFYRRMDATRRPWNPEVHFRLARCLEESGDNTAALEECKLALDLNPAHADALELFPRIPTGEPRAAE